RRSDPDYFDASEKTVRINALRAEDLAKMHGSGTARYADHEDVPELTTAEYNSAHRVPHESSSPRASAPRESSPRTVPSRVDPPPQETPRRPRPEVMNDAEDTPSGRAARGMLPAAAKRPSGRARAAAAAAVHVGRRRPG